MSTGSFGERLKRERELRGLSRDEICAATRIGSRFLEALENEQWDVLPGGVFNRGFIRAIARFLGLDEEDLVAEYDLSISQVHPLASIPILAPLPARPSKPRRRPFALVATATVAILVLATAGWFGWRWHYAGIHRAAAGPGSAAPTASASAQAQPNSSDASVGGSADSSFTTIGTASGQPQAPLSNLRGKIKGLELKVEAGKQTSVSVSADGSKVFDGSMIAGQSRTFTAQDAIDISAQDAGALLLELNGQTLAPLGPPGQPGNATFTRSDLKPAGGGAN